MSRTEFGRQTGIGRGLFSVGGSHSLWCLTRRHLITAGLTRGVAWRLAHWITGSLAHWLTGSLAHWLTGSLAHWLTGYRELIRQDSTQSRRLLRLITIDCSPLTCFKC
jgi:hypothetical protein